MRLGELLVSTGVITGEQRDAGVRQQVVYGGRLGTNLIELGYATPDQIAHGLARLLHVPAALERHFEQHDPDALTHIPAALAARCEAFPLAFAETREGRRLVVCLRDPNDTYGAVHGITELSGTPVLFCAAPELVLYYWLERCYGIPRPTRLKSAHVGAAEPLPSSDSDRVPAVHQAELLEMHSIDVDLDDELDMPATLELVDLDHGDVGRDYSHYDAPYDSTRESALDLGAAAANAVERHTAPAPAPAPTPKPGPTLTADQAARAVRDASSREEISAALVAYLRGRFGAGLIVIAKENMALGHRGCGGNFDDESVESILIPLGAPSMFRTAFEAKKVCAGPPPSGGKAIQDRFFKLFPGGVPSEVIVMPVVLKDRVVSMIYAHDAGGARVPRVAVGELEMLATETADAYRRLIKQAKR